MSRDHIWCDNARNTRGGASIFPIGIFPLIGLSGDYAIGNTRVYPLYVWAHGSPFIGPFYSGVGEPIFTKRRGAAGGLCAQSDMRVRKSAPEAAPRAKTIRSPP